MIKRFSRHVLHSLVLPVSLMAVSGESSIAQETCYLPICINLEFSISIQIDISPPDTQRQNAAPIEPELANEQVAPQAVEPLTEEHNPELGQMDGGVPNADALTGTEKAAIGDILAGYWNKGLITSQPEYEQYVVRVAVKVNRFGAIEGEVRPVEPADPTGIFRIAFDAARRAIFQAGTIPLPSDRYPEGMELILRFDPASGEVGLN